MLRTWWLLALMACGNGIGEPGDPCRTSVDCEEISACFETRMGGPRCMRRCDADTVLCEDGSVCLAGGSGIRVCYIGGDLPLGEPCAGGGDCALGLSCIDVDGEGGEQARCERACDLRRVTCPAGSACAEVTSIEGYCVVAEEADE